MIVSIENTTPPRSTDSRHSYFLVQIKIEPKSWCVPRDTEKSEFLDLVGFGGVAFAVETVKKGSTVKKDLG